MCRYRLRAVTEAELTKIFMIYYAEMSFMTKSLTWEFLLCQACDRVAGRKWRHPDRYMVYLHEGAPMADSTVLCISVLQGEASMDTAGVHCKRVWFPTLV